MFRKTTVLFLAFVLFTIAYGAANVSTTTNTTTTTTPAPTSRAENPAVGDGNSPADGGSPTTQASLSTSMHYGFGASLVLLAAL